MVARPRRCWNSVPIRDRRLECYMPRERIPFDRRRCGRRGPEEAHVPGLAVFACCRRIQEYYRLPRKSANFYRYKNVTNTYPRQAMAYGSKWTSSSRKTPPWKPRTTSPRHSSIASKGSRKWTGRSCPWTIPHTVQRAMRRKSEKCRC